MPKKIFLLIYSALILCFTGCALTNRSISVPIREIESTSSISDLSNLAEGEKQESAQEEPLFQFYGSVFVDDEEYPLSVKYYGDNESSYHIEISVMTSTHIIPLSEDSMPVSIERGFQICDVNRDGNDDILIELGI